MLLNQYDTLVKELDCIVINIGPGSFTGLRIGVSFAKGLCMANKIPLIPLKSFDIMKNKISYSDTIFYICIYSHKDYAYAQKYNSNGEIVKSPKLIDLKSKTDTPIYMSGLVKKYDNNIVNVNFTSLDLLKIVKEEKLYKQAINDLNSINPIYIDYMDNVD